MMPVSRFASFSRTHAVLVIGALLLIIGVGFIQPMPSPSAKPVAAAKPQIADADLLLYQTINSRIAHGEPYYSVTAQELRRGVYPLKPFVTFRLPTLAFIMGWIGPVASVGILWMLLGFVLWAWWRRLDGAFDDPGRRITGIMLITAGSAVIFQPRYVVMHELWAGLLIALALALRSSPRWWWAVIAGAAALMIRELALPFILLLTAFALYERRWRELLAWTAVLLVFAATMGWHATQVAAVVNATDLSSPGWLSIGGWQGFLRTMRMTSAIRVLPDWLGSISVILAIFGWISWRSVTGLFGSLLLIGYAIIFMVLGRPDNFYWGLLIAPLLLLGLAFLPRAFADLRTAAAPRKANWT